MAQQTPNGIAGSSSETVTQQFWDCRAREVLTARWTITVNAPRDAWADSLLVHIGGPVLPSQNNGSSTKVLLEDNGTPEMTNPQLASLKPQPKAQTGSLQGWPFAGSWTPAAPTSNNQQATPNKPKVTPGGWPGGSLAGNFGAVRRDHDEGKPGTARVQLGMWKPENAGQGDGRPEGGVVGQIVTSAVIRPGPGKRINVCVHLRAPDECGVHKSWFSLCDSGAKPRLYGPRMCAEVTVTEAESETDEDQLNLSQLSEVDGASSQPEGHGSDDLRDALRNEPSAVLPKPYLNGEEMQGVNGLARPTPIVLQRWPSPGAPEIGRGATAAGSPTHAATSHTPQLQPLHTSNSDSSLFQHLHALSARMIGQQQVLVRQSRVVQQPSASHSPSNMASPLISPSQSPGHPVRTIQQTQYTNRQQQQQGHGGQTQNLSSVAEVEPGVPQSHETQQQAQQTRNAPQQSGHQPFSQAFGSPSSAFMAPQHQHQQQQGGYYHGPHAGMQQHAHQGLHQHQTQAQNLQQHFLHLQNMQSRLQLQLQLGRVNSDPQYKFGSQSHGASNAGASPTSVDSGSWAQQAAHAARLHAAGHLTPTQMGYDNPAVWAASIYDQTPSPVYPVPLPLEAAQYHAAQQYQHLYNGPSSHAGLDIKSRQRSRSPDQQDEGQTNSNQFGLCLYQHEQEQGHTRQEQGATPTTTNSATSPSSPAGLNQPQHGQTQGRGNITITTTPAGPDLLGYHRPFSLGLLGEIVETAGKRRVARDHRLDDVEGLSDLEGFPSDGLEGTDEIDFKDLKLGEKIGEGTYGEVFKGSLWGQQVAVKKLRITGLKPSDIRDFNQEVKIMRSLRHPNIVEFLGACYVKPRYCMITEFLPNGSLERLMVKQRENGKKMSVKRILQFAGEIARGLNWLHHKGIIHRDLKTENILVGKHNNLKIADFGLSHMKTRQMNDTGFYGVCGTPCYMAPEVLRKAPYGVKCDVFSFGMILCELVMGEYPFEHNAECPSKSDAFDEAIVRGLRPKIPDYCFPALRELIERCWRESPDERPTVDEIMACLEDIDKKLEEVAEDILEDVPDKVVELFKEEKRRQAELESELRDARSKARAMEEALMRETRTRQEAERLLALYQQQHAQQFLQQQAGKKGNRALPFGFPSLYPASGISYANIAAGRDRGEREGKEKERGEIKGEIKEGPQPVSVTSASTQSAQQQPGARSITPEKQRQQQQQQQPVQVVTLNQEQVQLQAAAAMQNAMAAQHREGKGAQQRATVAPQSSPTSATTPTTKAQGQGGQVRQPVKQGHVALESKVSVKPHLGEWQTLPTLDSNASIAPQSSPVHAAATATTVVSTPNSSPAKPDPATLALSGYAVAQLAAASLVSAVIDSAVNSAVAERLHQQQAQQQQQTQQTQQQMKTPVRQTNAATTAASTLLTPVDSSVKRATVISPQPVKQDQTTPQTKKPGQNQNQQLTPTQAQQPATAAAAAAAQSHAKRRIQPQLVDGGEGNSELRSTNAALQQQQAQSRGLSAWVSGLSSMGDNTTTANMPSPLHLSRTSTPDGISTTGEVSPASANSAASTASSNPGGMPSLLSSSSSSSSLASASSASKLFKPGPMQPAPKGRRARKRERRLERARVAAAEQHHQFLVASLTPQQPQPVAQSTSQFISVATAVVGSPGAIGTAAPASSVAGPSPSPVHFNIANTNAKPAQTQTTGQQQQQTSTRPAPAMKNRRSGGLQSGGSPIVLPLDGIIISTVPTITTTATHWTGISVSPSISSTATPTTTVVNSEHKTVGVVISAPDSPVKITPPALNSVAPSFLRPGQGQGQTQVQGQSSNLSAVGKPGKDAGVALSSLSTNMLASTSELGSRIIPIQAGRDPAAATATTTKSGTSMPGAKQPPNAGSSAPAVLARAPQQQRNKKPARALAA